MGGGGWIRVDLRGGRGWGGVTGGSGGLGGLVWVGGAMGVGWG